VDGLYIAALKTNNIDPDGPEGLSTVHSWQCIVEDPLHPVEKLIAVGAPDEIADIIGGRELTECYKTDYWRAAAILHMPDGLRVELAMDQGEMIKNGKSKPMLRLELELLFGGVGDLLSFAKMLRENYGLEYETRSRFQRVQEM
jgi:inorganic triphosphatase YgiF